MIVFIKNYRRPEKEVITLTWEYQGNLKKMIFDLGLKR